MEARTTNDFEMAAAKKQSRGLFAELLGLLNQTKKWWLFPVVIAMLLIGLLIVLSGTAVAPFIYTLF
jgi:hypothetical protein